jgi:Predicted spermidine synthase with an N-terminal membrane domain
MKLHFSSAEKARLQTLFETFDQNMADADAYNAILEKKTPVHESKSPLLIHQIDPKPYEKDDYYQIVKPQAFQSKGWTLFYDRYEPNEGFVYDELSIDPKTYKETTRFGFFTTAFPFLALAQDGRTWMSVTPHEINTMQNEIHAAKGKVITFGLGLGYYAYEVLKKADVSSVSVIEKDPTLIAFFSERILPFFPHPEKFHIIEEDAFHYAEKMAKDHYDYAFVDLWHLPEDGLPLYLRMRSLEKKNPQTTFSYWVEPSLLSLLRRAFLILLQEEMNGSSDEDYDFAATESDALINKMHKVNKSLTLSSYDEVLNVLSDASLKNMALRLG